MINGFMGNTQFVNMQVSSPAISMNYRPLLNILFNYFFNGLFVTFLYLDQETSFLSSLLDTTYYPGSIDSSTTMIFTSTKLRFINFYNNPITTNFLFVVIQCINN